MRADPNAGHMPTGTCQPSLWIAGADGTQARALVPPGQFPALSMPCSSPEAGSSGSRPTAATARARAVLMDLWLVEASGGNLDQLAALGGDDVHAAWSPDGMQPAYLSGEGVSVLDLTIGAATRLAAVAGYGALDWPC